MGLVNGTFVKDYFNFKHWDEVDEMLQTTYAFGHFLAINTTSREMALPGDSDGFLGLMMPVDWEGEEGRE